MIEFVVTTVGDEQGVRILDVADELLGDLVKRLPQAEWVATASVVVAMAIAVHLMSEESEDAAIDYVVKTIETVLPTMRERCVGALRREGRMS